LGCEYIALGFVAAITAQRDVAQAVIAVVIQPIDSQGRDGQADGGLQAERFEGGLLDLAEIAFPWAALNPPQELFFREVEDGLTAMLAHFLRIDPDILETLAILAFLHLPGRVAQGLIFGAAGGALPGDGHKAKVDLREGQNIIWVCGLQAMYSLNADPCETE
jgi:hypothetical protein